MKNHLLQYLIIVPFFMTLASCVSISLPTGSGNPAKDVKFEEPAKPFENIKVKTADKTWISNKTGNTISYVSDCNSSSDLSLQQLENESLVVLNKLKVLDTKQFNYNGREASTTLAEGEVDGVAVKTQILVFKKNNCNFTLSYGGVRNQFDNEAGQFKKFTESFRAP